MKQLFYGFWCWDKENNKLKQDKDKLLYHQHDFETVILRGKSDLMLL